MDGVVVEAIDIGETNPFNDGPDVPASVDHSDIPPPPTSSPAIHPLNPPVPQVAPLPASADGECTHMACDEKGLI